MYFGSRCRLIMEKIGMLFGSQISCADLRFLYSMLSDSISDRTIVLLFPVTLLALTQPSNVYTFSNQRYKSTMQMCRRICVPPEINIRIFNPLSSFLLFNDSMMQIDVQKTNRNAFRITDPYILCCRIAYPTEQQPCCFRSICWL